MHSILQDKEEMAKQDFQDTMNLHHRVDSVDFIDIISKMKGVLNAISQFKNFITRHTGHKLHFFQKAIQIATKNTKRDLDLIMEQIKKHDVVYSTYMKHERDAIVKIFEKFANSVEQFATNFKLEHPCVDDIPAESLTNKIKTLENDFNDMKNMTDFYQKLYGLSLNHNRSSSNTSVFTMFPQYAHAQFLWAEGKNIPIKAVIDEEAIKECNEFWINFDTFKENFTNAKEMLNTYSREVDKINCNKAENSAELTTGGSAIVSSIGSSSESDSGLGGTSAIGYTTSHTDYISDTLSSNRLGSDDVSLVNWSNEEYRVSTVSTFYSQNATNTTLGNNSGDALSSNGLDSDDLNLGNWSNEGYRASTVSTIYSQNATNITTGKSSGDALFSNSGDSDDISFGNWSNEGYIASTVSTLYSQNVNTTNTTTVYNSGDALFSNSGDSDDLSSEDLTNEGYIMSTISSVYSQNATNTTSDNDNNSGDLASEGDNTSTTSTNDSQHVTYASNSDPASAYSSASNTASLTESIETCNDSYYEYFDYSYFFYFSGPYWIDQIEPSYRYYPLSAKLDQFSFACKKSLATVNVCLTDYGNFLQQTLKEFEEIKQESHSVETYLFDVTDLDKIEGTMYKIYDKYITNKSSKLDLANKLLAETNSSLSSLNDLILVYSQHFEQETITSTKSQLRKIKESLVNDYGIMIETFLALVEYMDNTIKCDEVEQFDIFRNPLPTVEDSEYVTYEHTKARVKREIGNKPKMFLREKAKELVETALGRFFHKLFSDLRELHKQFVEVKSVFVSAVTDLKEALQTHQAELTIGPAFVR